MPEIVQEIGSYAGFAAVVGLAVLSALYFSQARDVKRLREWAGRAPERAAEQEARIQAAAQQPAAAAQQPAAAAQPGAKPAVQPVPGKAPAGAGAAAGAPAAAPAPAPASQPAPGQTATKAPPAPVIPAARPAANSASRPAAAGASPSKTSILPPPARPRPPWYQRIHWPAPRYIVLIVVGILVVGGGAAYGVTQLLEEDQPAQGTGAATGNGDQAGSDDAGDSRGSGRVNPSTVTVSVLNGTTVPGLAAQIADKVESGGFQRGNVANATEQQRAESVVLYAPGSSREARAVARRLKISQIEQADAGIRALAGDATVVVVVGADQTQ
jgi:hypothetical protein